MVGVGNANGKIILFGEHAVVWGKRAIAAGISTGARATAESSKEPELWFGDMDVHAAAGRPEAQAFAVLLAQLGAPCVRVRVETELPLGVGLGSSAAVGVAIARAVMQHQGTAPDAGRVLAAATAWEDVFHGKSSGIDAAAACYGGCITFQRGAPPQRLSPGVPLCLGVAVAGPAASTREMVNQVAQFQARDPEAFDASVNGIETLVRNAEQAILHGDLPTLGKLMDLNHMLLAGWFLSTPEIEHACQLARGAGALGAKLTGSGGGGCVIALAAGLDATPLLDAWRAQGLRCFSACVSDAPEDAPRKSSGLAE